MKHTLMLCLFSLFLTAQTLQAEDHTYRHFPSSVYQTQDGKLVLAANYAPSSGGPDRTLIARYHSNGKLDHSFYQNGALWLDKILPVHKFRMNSLLPDKKGGWLLTGSHYPGGESKPERFLIRFNQDFSLDVGFGTAGVVVFGKGDPYFDEIRTAVQFDGKILSLYAIQKTGQLDHFLSRFNEDGSLDQTYGKNGTVLLPDGLNGWPNIALHSDGTLVCSASFSFEDNLLPVLYYDINGQLLHRVSSREPVFGGPAIFLQDGKLLSFGNKVENSKISLLLARRTANGKLDPTFGKNGFHLQRFPEDGGFSSIKIVDGGKFQITQTFDDSHHFVTNYLRRIQFLANGSFDKSFGKEGIGSWVRICEKPVYTQSWGGDENLTVAQAGSEIGVQSCSSATENDGHMFYKWGANGKLDPNFAHGNPVKIQWPKPN